MNEIRNISEEGVEDTEFNPNYVINKLGDFGSLNQGLQSQHHSELQLNHDTKRSLCHSRFTPPDLCQPSLITSLMHGFAYMKFKNRQSKCTVMEGGALAPERKEE